MAFDVSNLLTGGILGAIGPMLGEVLALFKTRIEHKNKIEILKLENEGKIRQAEANQETARESTFRASITGYYAGADGYRWVSALKSMMIPIITFMLYLFTAWIYNSSAPSFREELAAYIVGAAISTTYWWIGIRNNKMIKVIR